MTNEYELADSSRESLIYTKEQLLAGLEEGMVETPHAIFPGMDEQDYYRGPGHRGRARHGSGRCAGSPRARTAGRHGAPATGASRLRRRAQPADGGEA